MIDSVEPVTPPGRGAWWLVIALVAGTLVFFLWEEHRAHLLGALPYLLLLACPLVHLLMHGRHDGRSDHSGHEGGSLRHGGQS